MEFPELLSQNHKCCHWLSVIGNPQMMHCGIPFKTPHYFLSSVHKFYEYTHALTTAKQRLTKPHIIWYKFGEEQFVDMACSRHIPRSSRLAILISMACMDILTWFSFWFISSIFIIIFSTLQHKAKVMTLFESYYNI